MPMPRFSEPVAVMLMVLRLSEPDAVMPMVLRLPELVAVIATEARAAGNMDGYRRAIQSMWVINASPTSSNRRSISSSCGSRDSFKPLIILRTSAGPIVPAFAKFPKFTRHVSSSPGLRMPTRLPILASNSRARERAISAALPKSLTKAEASKLSWPSLLASSRRAETLAAIVGKQSPSAAMSWTTLGKSSRLSGTVYFFTSKSCNALFLASASASRHFPTNVRKSWKRNPRPSGTDKMLVKVRSKRAPVVGMAPHSNKAANRCPPPNSSSSSSSSSTWACLVKTRRKYANSPKNLFSNCGESPLSWETWRSAARSNSTRAVPKMFASWPKPAKSMFPSLSLIAS
mmetsp:Transcript_62407/g.179480  ORF Transcript_62407/g.179480 Transcript_62407/m.179480 type:complete len:345 (-) Transcript_62407:1302-2336(-)